MALAKALDEVERLGAMRTVEGAVIAEHDVEGRMGGLGKKLAPLIEWISAAFNVVVVKWRALRNRGDVESTATGGEGGVGAVIGAVHHYKHEMRVQLRARVGETPRGMRRKLTKRVELGSESNATGICWGEGGSAPADRGVAPKVRDLGYR